MTHDMEHMDFLETVASDDVAVLRRKEATYRGSWKREGGRSAWFMLRRKIDRLLVIMARPETPDAFNFERLNDALRNGASTPSDIAGYLLNCYAAENVFAMIRRAPRGEDGSALAEMRDLRRYLLLVEAEMMARGVVEPETSDSRPPRHPPTGGYSTGGRVGPGTPEDGGHHAREEPADVGQEYTREAEAELATWKTQHADAPFEIHGQSMTAELAPFYHRRTKNVWRLEEWVHSDSLPTALRGAYLRLPATGALGTWWLLDRGALREVPDTLPRFSLEMNDCEIATLPTPYALLYERGADNKWHMEQRYAEHWGVAA